MSVDTVERKIMFYRIRPRPYPDGSLPRVAVADILSEIKKLTFDKTSTGPKSRYCSVDDRLLCAWPHQTFNRTRVQLGMVRRIDLPSIDDGGNVKPLPIADDEGLLEITHLQFFANGIVGAEFNFYGPRATAFADYVDEKIPTIPKFRLEPLLRRDVQSRLGELQDIRMVNIRVHKSEATSLAAISSSLPGAFRQLTHDLDGETFEIILRAERGKSLSERLRGALHSLLASSRSLADCFEVLKIGGQSSITERTTELNLLRDQFIQSKHIAKMHGKTRAVSESKMYEAIESSYNALRQELELASSVETE